MYPVKSKVWYRIKNIIYNDVVYGGLDKLVTLREIESDLHFQMVVSSLTISSAVKSNLEVR